MPKLVLAIGAEAAAVEAVEGFANYSGPTPPAGVYPAVIKQIGMTESKTGKDMFRAVVEFKAPKGDSRKKYDGYAIFHHLVLPGSPSDEHYGLQIGQINRMLDAMSNNDVNARKILWGGKADTDAAGKKITKIGKLDLTDKAGIPVLVSARTETFKRKVLKNGKPVKDPRTGKELFEEATNLRVNDFFPIDDERGKPQTDEEFDAVADAEIYADDGLVDEVDLVDDVEPEAVVADDESGLDGVDGDADGTDSNDDLEGLDADDSADIPDDQEIAESADTDADDIDPDSLIAQEVPDEEPAVEAEPEPEAPRRRRRSAF